MIGDLWLDLVVMAHVTLESHSDVYFRDTVYLYIRLINPFILLIRQKKPFILFFDTSA